MSEPEATGAWQVDFAGKPWRLKPGERWVVTGPMASGKTWLGAQLQRQAPDEVAFVTVGAQAGSAGTDWAGARYHASIEYDFRTVAEALTYERVNGICPFEVRPPELTERAAFAKRLAWVTEALCLEPLLDRWTVQLSNGEQRRVMLAQAILKGTPVLVLDDPFAGLDPAMRETLHRVLATLAEQGQTMVLMVRNEDEIPACVTHRLRLKACHIVSQGPYTPPKATATKLTFPPNPPALNTPVVLSVRELSLDLGGRTLFGGLTWEAHAGERWVIIGPNGSGKTTLLSLITGDNPIAYACDIERFGKKPGPGVPLWQLRSRMATVSPEDQVFADPTQTVGAAVFSGLFDKEGRHKRPSAHQRERAQTLLTTLGLHERLHDPLGTLSAGLVRLTLLVRALVAEPELLLLDELCMNLEEPERKKVLRLVDRLLAELPSLTVLCIVHRADHIPPHFNRVLALHPATAK